MSAIDQWLGWAYEKNIPTITGAAIITITYLWLTIRAIRGKPGGLLIGFALAAIVAATYLYIEGREQ